MKNLSIYIGILAALVMALSDIILLGQPVSGSQYDLSSFGAIEHVGSFRASAGSLLGLVASFFICFGFWYLKTLFEEVSPKLSMLFFISLCSMMFFGGAFHATYYFIAAPGMAGIPNLIPQIVLDDFRNHLEILSYLAVPGFIIGTIVFVKLASHRQFPSWYKFCNPLVLCVVFLLLFYFLPAPVGGYIRPTFINLALATWFYLSKRVASEK